MPNKIRLCTGQEFELVGYGMMKDENRKEIQFRFSSDAGIGEVQTAFKDATAIDRIDYILTDGTIRETIADCAEYLSIMQDSEGKYIVTLSIDKMAVELKNTKEDLQDAKDKLNAAQGELDTVKTELQTTSMVLNAILTEVIPQVIELIMPPEELPEGDPEEEPEE